MCESVLPPKLGNSYIKSVQELEDMKSIQNLSNKVYGYIEVMAGIVSGHNQVLSGIEYHQGSETIIAVSDFILVVGYMRYVKSTLYSYIC